MKKVIPSKSLSTVKVLLLAFIALGFGASVSAQVPAAAPAPPLIRPHTPTLGPANAKVHVVEFLDPACEGCRAFYPVVKQLMSENPGRIRLWVRYVPIHKGSDFVVKALEAARAHGKFWEGLGLLFAKQD